MGVERLRWAEASGKVIVPALLIAGIPYLILPDGVDVTGVAWTDDPDTAWHVGAEPVTRGWLAVPGSDLSPPPLVVDEQARPAAGELSVAAVTVWLVDIEHEVTRLFASRDVLPQLTLSQTVAPADTTIHVDTAGPLPSSGVVHLGRERITYTGKTGTTITGCVRGTAGTKARRYAVGASTSRDVVGRTFVWGPRSDGAEALPSVLGRRATLWALELDADGVATNPTLLFDGRVGQGVDLAAGGAVWAVPIDHALKAFSEKSSVATVRLYGYAHGQPSASGRGTGRMFLADAYNPLVALWGTTGGVGSLTFLGRDAALPDSGGWHPSRDAFLRDWNAAARAYSIGATLEGDGRCSVWAHSNTDLRLTVSFGWCASDTVSDPAATDDAAEDARVRSPDPMPEACLWLAGRVHLDAQDAANLPTSPGLASDSVGWSWTLTCERENPAAAKEKIVSAYTGPDTNSVTCSVVDGGVNGPALLSIRSLLVRPTQASLGLRAEGPRWWTALAYGVVDQVGSYRGVDWLADSLDLARIAAVAQRVPVVPTTREYRVDPSKPLLEILATESRLSGGSLATYRGRLALARIREVAPTERMAATVLVTDLVEGEPPTYTEARDGTVTSLKLSFEGRPEADGFRVVDGGAVAEAGAGTEIEARVPLGAYPPDADLVALAPVLGDTMVASISPWSRPYRTVTVRLPVTFGDVEIGDSITVSEWVAPNGLGGHGLEAVPAAVMGRRLDPWGLGVVELTLRLSRAGITGYAPEVIVDKITGAVVDADPTTALGESGYAPDGDTDGGASFFEPGDMVLLVEIGAESPATPEAAEVASVSGIAITLAALPDPSWATLASTSRVAVVFDEYATAVARQRRYAYAAARSTLTIVTGVAARRWA